MDYGAMARATMQGKATLDARFKFADTAFSSGTEGWNSQLRFATGIADGEDAIRKRKASKSLLWARTKKDRKSR